MSYSLSEGLRDRVRCAEGRTSSTSSSLLERPSDGDFCSKLFNAFSAAVRRVILGLRLEEDVRAAGAEEAEALGSLCFLVFSGPLARFEAGSARWCRCLFCRALSS